MLAPPGLSCRSLVLLLSLLLQQQRASLAVLWCWTAMMIQCLRYVPMCGLGNCFDCSIGLLVLVLPGEQSTLLPVNTRLVLCCSHQYHHHSLLSIMRSLLLCACHSQATTCGSWQPLSCTPCFRCCGESAQAPAAAARPVCTHAGPTAWMPRR